MKVAKLLAMAAVVGLFSYALVAAEGDAPKPERPKGLRGTVVKVDGANLVIKKMAKEEADRVEVTVLTDAKTKVTIGDNADAKVADLKADMRVFITPEDAGKEKAAVTIKVMPPRKPKAE
jgi:hypothetical protein